MQRQEQEGPERFQIESRIAEVQFSMTTCNDESAQMISLSASYRLYSNFH